MYTSWRSHCPRYATHRYMRKTQSALVSSARTCKYYIPYHKIIPAQWPCYHSIWWDSICLLSSAFLRAMGNVAKKKKKTTCKDATVMAIFRNKEPPPMAIFGESFSSGSNLIYCAEWLIVHVMVAYKRMTEEWMYKITNCHKMWARDTSDAWLSRN